MRKWREAHKRWLEQLPADVRGAHAHSSNHRAEVLASRTCGCFYCCSVFPPNEIAEWVDRGTTALCPRCGIDSIIGDRSGYDVSAPFLEKMKAYWFDETAG